MPEEVLEQPPLREMRQSDVDLSAVAMMAKAIARRRSTIKDKEHAQEKKPARTGKNRFRKNVAALTALGRLGGSLPKPEPLEPAPLLRVVRRLRSFLQRSGETLPGLFAKIDTDGSGSVDIVEFRQGLRLIGLVFDDPSIASLLQLVDSDGDGQLESEEFCTRIGEMIEKEATQPQVVLSQLSIHLHAKRITPQALFDELDTDGTGDLDAAEFQAVLAHIGVYVSEQASSRAMAALDVDGDGTLETKELALAVEEYQRQRRVWAATVLGNLLNYVKETKLSVQRVFAHVDVDGSGNLDVQELQEAMLKLGQDLSELDVEEIMYELDLDGDSLVIATSQFLDNLKKFEAERRGDTAKCLALFEKYDDDKSGSLDCEEVALLAGEMGLETQVQDQTFLSNLIDDIENARRAARDQEDDEEEASDGHVSYEEFLPWFLSVGRSYLPRPHYAATLDMKELSQEQLDELFDKIDEDHGGEVCEHETQEAVINLYPYLGVRNTRIAFLAADRDGGGVIDKDEFAALFRCLAYLNKHRHSIDEITQQGDEMGVNHEDFYMNCAVLSIELTDREVDRCYAAACRSHGCTHEAGLDTDQFLSWVVRRECIDMLSHEAREEINLQWQAAELDSLGGEYGDVFLEDLASVVVQGQRRMHVIEHDQPQSSAVATRNLTKARMLKANKEFQERFQLLKSAMQGCMERADSFPQVTDEVIRSLVPYAGFEVFFAGQNICTQGILDDNFFVIRRGIANVIVTKTDEETGSSKEIIVDTVRAGGGFGEMGMLHGFKRTASVRCAGPCEVLSISKANYDTSIMLMGPEDAKAKLEVMMNKFWDLVTGPSGSGRPEVDYAAYLKMSVRISKVLYKAEDTESFDAEEERGIAQEDWASDCKRYGLKVTDSLSLTVFFNSIYELVDTWAGDTDISFPNFLEKIFVNIADLSDEKGGHWVFKKLEKVQCDGETFETMKEEAVEAMAEAERQRQAASKELEQRRIQHDMRAEDRKKRLASMKADQDNAKQQANELAQLKAKLVGLDEEEAELRRQLAAGNLSAEEEEAIRRRLAQIAQERIAIQISILELQKEELRRKIESGNLSPEDAEEMRQLLAGLEQSSLQLKIDALNVEEAELRRQLASGNLTAAEAEAIRRRLAEIAQERIAIEVEKLSAEELEIKRRLATGMLSAAEEEEARRRLADIARARVQLKIDAIKAEEAELRRQLATGMLSAVEEEAIRNRLASLEQQRISFEIEKLALEEAELRRRIASGSLSAEETELALRRLSAIGLEGVRLKLDALDAEEKELHRLLESGNLSEVEERKLRERLIAIAQDRVALKVEAAELEMAELQRRLASGILSGEEEEVARRRLLDLEGELKELQEQQAELQRRLAVGQLGDGSGACLDDSYQPMQVAPRTPGVHYTGEGWAEATFKVGPLPQSVFAADGLNNTGALRLSERSHTGRDQSPLQHGTKIRPQQKQLDNFEALLSREAGQAALRQSFEKTAATTSLSRWRGYDRGYSEGYDYLSTSMFQSSLSTRNTGSIAARFQTHALAHAQHSPLCSRVSYPGNDNRRCRKKKHGKKLSVSGNDCQTSYIPKQTGRGYMDAPGSPSLSQPQLRSKNKHKHKRKGNLSRSKSTTGFLPQLSSPQFVRSSSTSSPSERQHIGCTKVPTALATIIDYKKQQQTQRQTQ